MWIEFLTWLQGLPLVRAVATSALLYPIVNGTHILAFAVILGAITVHNIAVLGNRATRDLAAATLPLAVSTFGLAALSGFVLFAARAAHYAENPAMQIKAALLGIAIADVALARCTHSITIRKWLATFSLVLWFATLFAGRWIGFL